MIKYVEFARQVVFRGLPGGDVNVGGAVSGSERNMLTDLDWDMETNGSYLSCRHRKSGMTYLVPAVHVVAICRGVDATTKATAPSSGGAGKR